MAEFRRVQRVLRSEPTIEGAGVRLKRAFGYNDSLLDPFLLLDDFHSDNPEDYIAGFPWHPHRGIETITYMLEGEVAHGDSMGNKGVIGAGDVQWMTAGSGIIHEEMPHQGEVGLWGFQLWANLPASHKMMSPRYRGLTNAEIPEVQSGDGISVKVICGEISGVKGPVTGIITDPEYLDVSLQEGTTFEHSIQRGHNCFAYVIDGEGHFNGSQSQPIEKEHLAIFGDGDSIKVVTRDQPLRFLLISGNPIREPVAWYGPIVMNTREELEKAFEEYRNGTFVKHK